MNEQNKLRIEDVASLLFFTRAAAEPDPALASSVLEAPFLPRIGMTILQWPGSLSPSLTIAGLYRVWDSGVALRLCWRCGSRMLFLEGRGGVGGASFFGFLNFYCPFCREMGKDRVSCPAYREVERTVSDIVKGQSATNPGLPIGDAMAKLGEFRTADLLDSGHPLEKASLKAAGVSPPVLTGHPDEAVMWAQALQLVSSPKILEFIRKLKANLQAGQAKRVAEVEAELAPLRGARGKPSPKHLFNCGDLSLEEYRKILHRKRELNASINPEKLHREIEDRAVEKTSKILGRELTHFEHVALLSLLTDKMRWANIR